MPPRSNAPAPAQETNTDRQITKSWREGVPQYEGTFLFGKRVGKNGLSGERLGRVMVLPNGNSVTYIGDASQPTTDFEGIVHFGPIPDVDRSLKAAERFAEIAAV